ncbi:MAG: ribosome silencing factor [Verrucomicrobiales bacterium]|nr:ribosome silencing factor [Verrucomicrobiales bacterium]
MTEAAIHPPLKGIELAQTCARYAADKKAADITILDVRGLSPITDFFVLCTATSRPHLRAIRDEVAAELKNAHHTPARVVDGSFESHWLILDFTDVVVHVFTDEKRGFYSLEDLWNDAPRIPFPATDPAP